MWNHYEAEAAVIASRTNAVEAWHFGLQALFINVTYHYPTLWTLWNGSKKIFKCNIHHFYKEFLVHNLLSLT